MYVLDCACLRSWMQTTVDESRASLSILFSPPCFISGLRSRKNLMTHHVHISFVGRILIIITIFLPCHRRRRHFESLGGRMLHDRIWKPAILVLSLVCLATVPSSLSLSLSPLSPSTTISALPMTTSMPDDRAGKVEEEQLLLLPPPFHESVLSYDHYNGVTLHLGKYQGWLLRELRQEGEEEDVVAASAAPAKAAVGTTTGAAVGTTTTTTSTTPSSPSSSSDADAAVPQPEATTTTEPATAIAAASASLSSSSFADDLATALNLWRAEGKRGVWIHAPPSAAHYIPACIHAGFDFHNIILTEAKTEAMEARTLVLTRWLPPTPSRLPVGPTHQVGVGVVLLNPSDPSQMLVVQELSGPGTYSKGQHSPNRPVCVCVCVGTLPDTSVSSHITDALDHRCRYRRSLMLARCCCCVY